jgi:hypothetical protein
MIVALVAAGKHLIVPTVLCGVAAVGFALAAQRLSGPDI